MTCDSGNNSRTDQLILGRGVNPELPRHPRVKLRNVLDSRTREDSKVSRAGSPIPHQTYSRQVHENDSNSSFRPPEPHELRMQNSRHFQTIRSTDINTNKTNHNRSLASHQKGLNRTHHMHECHLLAAPTLGHVLYPGEGSIAW